GIIGSSSAMLGPRPKGSAREFGGPHRDRRSVRMIEPERDPAPRPHPRYSNPANPTSPAADLPPPSRALMRRPPPRSPDRRNAPSDFRAPAPAGRRAGTPPRSHRLAAA